MDARERTSGHSSACTDAAYHVTAARARARARQASVGHRSNAQSVAASSSPILGRFIQETCPRLLLMPLLLTFSRLCHQSRRGAWLCTRRRCSSLPCTTRWPGGDWQTCGCAWREVRAEGAAQQRRDCSADVTPLHPHPCQARAWSGATRWRDRECLHSTWRCVACAALAWLQAHRPVALPTLARCPPARLPSSSSRWWSGLLRKRRVSTAFLSLLSLSSVAGGAGRGRLHRGHRAALRGSAGRRAELRTSAPCRRQSAGARRGGAQRAAPGGASSLSSSAPPAHSSRRRTVGICAPAKP